MTETTPRPPSRAGRIARVVGTLALVGLAIWHLSPRPRSLPLATSIDGPRPEAASGVIVFLHGRGATLARAEQLAKRLRQAGLPSDFAIVMIEGPYTSGLGHYWGDSEEEQATTRARIRERIGELLPEGGPPARRVVIAGFSQGAGVALDTAVEERRIGAVASLSLCYSMLRGQLPKRDSLRVLLAHGRSDTRCPVEESRSLARVLEAAQKPARYIEFDEGHVIPEQVVRAFVAFATEP